MKRILLTVLLGFMVTGCVSVDQTGYLDNYDQLKTSGTAKVYVDEAVKNTVPLAVSVNRPQIADSIQLESYAANMVADYLQQALEDALAGNDSFSQGGAYRLESYIGVFDPGNGFVRWFFGMGLGSSKVQVEAKLIEVSTGRAVVTFAEKKLDAGNAFFGLNMSEMDDDVQTKNTFKAIAKSFASQVAKQLKKK